ncbi:MAG: hypothetical protein LVQ96_07280 [Thermoplasmatales archaeon]|nr:hypothetical protein [Thermoplasmatales archaeon]
MEEGFKGIREPIRSGRSPRLSNMLDAIGRDLRKNPMDLGYKQNPWDGKSLAITLRRNTVLFLEQDSARGYFES